MSINIDKILGTTIEELEQRHNIERLLAGENSEETAAPEFDLDEFLRRHHEESACLENRLNAGMASDDGGRTESENSEAGDEFASLRVCGPPITAHNLMRQLKIHG